MEFSKEKTLITHSNTFARFLGYNVRVRCDQQIKPKEKQEDEIKMDMIVLGVMIAGVGIYLVYALINPEKL